MTASNTRIQTTWTSRLVSPFVGDVPDHVRPALAALQHQRLFSTLPMLCIAMAATAIAMAVAVAGDLPLWQQLAPPAILVTACVLALVHARLYPVPNGSAEAWRRLCMAPLYTVPLGLVAGLWGVNAFTETEKYYCMVAPVFIGIAALVSATCLIAVPRAAIGAMLAATIPMVMKMFTYDNVGVHAMATIMIMMAIIQAWLVRDRFHETVRMLTLQLELNQLAESDSLTGLDNRLAFDRKLEAALRAGTLGSVALIDLDKFKDINDRHGHAAGDSVLTEVADRLYAAADGALSVARLGGDEFAILMPRSDADITAAIRGAFARPHIYNGISLTLSGSIGMVSLCREVSTADLLLREADRHLYADKASRRASRRSPTAMAPERQLLRAV